MGHRQLRSMDRQLRSSLRKSGTSLTPPTKMRLSVLDVEAEKQSNDASNAAQPIQSDNLPETEKSIEKGTEPIQSAPSVQCETQKDKESKQSAP